MNKWKKEHELIQNRNRVGTEFCMACTGSSAESDLTTHCSNQPITENDSLLISANKKDFVDGKWIYK